MMYRLSTKERQLVSLDREVEDQEIHLREYLLVLVKRRWMIFIVLALVVTAFAIYSFRQTPLYRSSSSLYIDRSGYAFVPDVISEAYNWQQYESFFNTQYKLLASKTLARRVIERLNLTSRDLASPAQKGNPKLILAGQKREEEIKSLTGQLLGMVEVAPVKGTNLCEIIFTTADPKLSMTLANAWAEEYVEYSLASQYQYTQKAEELLGEQIKTLQGEIADKEKSLQNYSLEKQVVKLDQDRSMSSKTLEDLNGALSVATQERISREVHFKDLQSANKDALPEVTTSGIIQQLKTEHLTLERQYTEKSKTYKPDYPEMLRLKSQMDQLEKRLGAETTEIYKKTLAAAGSQYQEASGKEQALQNQMQSFKRESAEMYRKEFSYERLVSEIDGKKQLLEALLKRQNETDVSAQLTEKKATTIRIVDRAEMPSGIFKPNIKRNLMYSVVLGLVIAIGMSFLLEYFDRTIKSSDDVEKYAQMPFLGIIPRYVFPEDEASNGTKKPAVIKHSESADHHLSADLMSLNDPNSMVTEAFRTVRTSLLLSFPEAPPHDILITSSRPGEGKTFTACNLAISLAQMQKRVALVDADMRNPRIHHIWNVPNEVGLSGFLTSDAPLEDVLMPTNVKGLSLIPSGRKTPRPAELLSSTRMENLIEGLRQNFDHVILDTPPLMPVADSFILAAKCSCVVMVIRGGETPREVVQMARQKLEKSDAVLAGVVLNSIDLNDPYYYYSYFSDYPYYYAKEDSKNEAALPPPTRKS
jgi:polysaccharide biosynthesis transport protein